MLFFCTLLGKLVRHISWWNIVSWIRCTVVGGGASALVGCISESKAHVAVSTAAEMDHG